ncbi:GNAT family N-acetyltransferase [Streptomyces marincola]|uniref:GNAT family N-acetyltransferase n=1 Tax=Streptomyces marincola TaxID=2878388 RepID=UPI001CF4630D|nr:GNAT family N-acetyltransferase [Streptomyces marincola]UCM86959.1 GNAT family N-acetyltransferase [Streptomyces marincola]
MDHDEVIALFDTTMRREAVADAPGARVERAGHVVRQVSAGPTASAWEGVLWSGLTEDTADAAIAAEVARFAALGREFEWKVYGHDRPRDLPERLRAAGFAPGESETLMVAETAALATSVPPPEGVELRPVTDADGVGLLAEVHREAFGGPLSEGLLRSLTARFGEGAGAGRPAAGEAAGQVVAVLAVAGGRPVSAARVDLTPGAPFAGLWGGGTVPDWRGRGVYRALVAYRAALAAGRGYRYVYADASHASRPILARLGFQALAVTTPFVHAPVAR